MRKKAKPESFIRQPNYPGGKKALDEFIRTNLRYPEEAIKHKVEGLVSVKFDTDVFGVVVEASIVHGIGYGCDEEALRLVKLLRYEKKKYPGLRVTFHRSINIHFRLQDNRTAPEQKEVRIQYQYSESKPLKSEGETFSYTIVTGK